MSHSFVSYSHAKYTSDNRLEYSDLPTELQIPWQPTELGEAFIREVPRIVTSLNATTDLLNEDYIRRKQAPPFRKIEDGTADRIGAAFMLTKAFYTLAKREFKTTARFIQPPYYNPNSEDVALIVDGIPYFHSTFPLNGASNPTESADEHLFVLLHTIGYTSHDSKLKRAVLESLIGGPENVLLTQAIAASKLLGSFDLAENDAAPGGKNFYTTLFKSFDQYCLFRSYLERLTQFGSDAIDRNNLISLEKALGKAASILSSHNSCLTTYVSSRLRMESPNGKITMDAPVNALLRIHSEVTMKLIIEYGEDL